MNSKLPRGLVFFAHDAPADYRRRRWLFVLVMGAVGLALIWPIYPLLSRFYPVLLGLPPSIGWVVLWLFVSLAALMALYRSDR